MSTEEMRVPVSSGRTPTARRAGAALAITAVLISGVVLGRLTTPRHQVLAPRPATSLMDLGTRSVGDLRRVEMFLALNEIGRLEER
jgi:hypothetical protein